jgi:hypothetical protein
MATKLIWDLFIQHNKETWFPLNHHQWMPSQQCRGDGLSFAGSLPRKQQKKDESDQEFNHRRTTDSTVTKKHHPAPV